MIHPCWGLFLMKNWNIFNHWEFSKSFFFINVFIKVSRILKLYSGLMIPPLDVSHIVAVLGSCGPTWWHMQPVRGDPQPFHFHLVVQFQTIVFIMTTWLLRSPLQAASATHPHSIKSIISSFYWKKCSWHINLSIILLLLMFLLDLFIQYEWFWLCGHLLTLWCCSFLYTIKKSIFRTAIWDSNRPQPLPSITLKHFIHVSYELLQLAAIMTFVQLQQAALCLCSRNPRRCQLCGWGDGSLFVLLLPSVMCGTWTSAANWSIGSTTGFHNHGEGPL